MSQPTPVAIYARYSTDRQDGSSIDDQLRRCHVFARDHAYHVVAEYTDAAKSGSSVHRADLQRLLAAAAATKGGPPFKAVLVDDLSRLSRDLGDTHDLVFRQLAAVDVVVVDCTTGTASNAPGARFMFGTKALFNDHYLEQVRTQTHRGLEGRALNGFHTGGHCYGYETVPQDNPLNPEKPHALPVINEKEAEVVRRIFSDSAKGIGVSRIAAALNQQGIPAPYDELGYRKAATGKGWSGAQVRNVLRNEKYVGRWVWNKSKWIHDPVRRNVRVRKARPESEWVTRQDENLRIVPQPLWDEAQAQQRKAPRKPGRPPGSATFNPARPHLLTGILKCGACGSSMSVTGSKKKGSTTYVSLGCSRNNSKGDAACSNRKSIAERLINETVLKAMVDFAASDKLHDWVTQAAKRQERTMKEDLTLDGRGELESRVRSQEARVQRVVKMMLGMEDSDALKGTLRTEEQKLRDLRAQMAELIPTKREAAAEAAAMSTEVSVAEVVERMQDVRRLAARDPERAREALHSVIDSVVLELREVNGETIYEPQVTLRLGALIQLVSGKRSCGGRI